MTSKTEDKKIETAPKKAESKKVEPKRVDVPRETPLETTWANSTDQPDFDRDQIAVHAWATTGTAEMSTTLANEMTLADAEELFFTAGAIAEEHRKRANYADALREAIAKRLATVSVETLRAEEEGKAPEDFAPKRVEPTPTATIPNFLG